MKTILSILLVIFISQIQAQTYFEYTDDCVSSVLTKSMSIKARDGDKKIYLNYGDKIEITGDLWYEVEVWYEDDCGNYIDDLSPYRQIKEYKKTKGGSFKETPTKYWKKDVIHIYIPKNSHQLFINTGCYSHNRT